MGRQAYPITPFNVQAPPECQMPGTLRGALLPGFLPCPLFSYPLRPTQLHQDLM